MSDDIHVNRLNVKVRVFLLSEFESIFHFWFDVTFKTLDEVLEHCGTTRESNIIV
jgi:hypothetical protein